MTCAPYRGTYPERALYCQPVHKYSRAAMEQGYAATCRDSPHDGLRAHIPPGCMVPPPFLLTLTRIWNCQSIQTIQDETSTRGTITETNYFAFHMRGGFAIRGNTMNLDISGEQVLYADPTMEFRYRESTGSAEQDYRWLKLCLSIVRASEWPQAELQRAMSSLYSTDTLAGLLRGLCIDEDEIQWWSGMAAHYCQHPHQSKKTEFLISEYF